jgi:hypothetical protein
MAPTVHPMGDYWQAITYRRLARGWAGGAWMSIAASLAIGSFIGCIPEAEPEE